jgi:UDP-N-acetylmuramate dehydrogenase (EC 1.1.1.158)
MLERTLTYRSQVPLAGLTSLKVGGNAEYLAQPRNISELVAAWQWAQAHSLPITLIGAGSNLLIHDQGLAGLVICTRQIRGAEFNPSAGTVKAVCGEPLVKLAWQCAERGWSGLQWGVGIPGTVGGMVYMNAGAQGGCCADILQTVEVLTPQGEVKTITASELDFAYRYSALQTAKLRGYWVLSAELQLQIGFDPHAIRAQTEQNLHKRQTTQPYHLPSCGSVFRNPYPHAAGQLIEQAGLKGFMIGRAQVSPLHANFIVNLGGATASNVYDVMRYVQETIYDQHGILLHPEVKLLGYSENSDKTWTSTLP